MFNFRCKGNVFVLLVKIFFISTCAVERKGKNVSSTYLLYTIGLNWAGQFSNQMFSKWHLKRSYNYREERIIDLLKSLKNEISRKNYDNFYLSDSKPRILYRLGKIHKAWRMEFQLFVQFCPQQARPLTN